MSHTEQAILYLTENFPKEDWWQTWDVNDKQVNNLVDILNNLKNK